MSCEPVVFRWDPRPGAFAGQDAFRGSGRSREWSIRGPWWHGLTLAVLPTSGFWVRATFLRGSGRAEDNDVPTKLLASNIRRVKLSPTNNMIIINW
jgi:hypothetical protein